MVFASCSPLNALIFSVVYFWMPTPQRSPHVPINVFLPYTIFILRVSISDQHYLELVGLVLHFGIYKTFTFNVNVLKDLHSIPLLGVYFIFAFKSKQVGAKMEKSTQPVYWGCTVITGHTVVGDMLHWAPRMCRATFS